MTKEELDTKLELHKKWLSYEDGGERFVAEGAYLRDANLRCANLESADLQGANLRGANLQGAKV